MADLAITVADVDALAGEEANADCGSVSLDQGDAIYLDSDRLAQKCDANAAATSVCDGICLNAAEPGQPVRYLKPGVTQIGSNIDLGATLDVGKQYVLSENAGKIKPVEDLNTGEYVTYLGAAFAADNLIFQVLRTGVTWP